MNRHDVRKGMKVVPHSKSIEGDWEESNTIQEMERTKAKFLYVTQIWDDGDIALSLELSGPSSGDLFLAQDFEPYVEE